MTTGRKLQWAAMAVVYAFLLYAGWYAGTQF